MYKYFERIQSASPKKEVSEKQLHDYKKQVIAIMKSKGASDNDIKLISDTVVATSIRNNHVPEDTAWAMLQ